MKRPGTAPHKRSESGFSLLEVSATMGILLILAGGIFSITSGAFQLTSELSDFQERNILKKRFIELCRMNLEEVPGHGKIEFKYADSGGSYARFLSIVEHPFAFSFGGNSANVHRVVIETEPISGGYFRVSLLYLNEEENLAWEEEALEPSVVQRRVVLLPRVRVHTWEFYDPNRQEWIDYWDQPRNPTLIAMQLTMADEIEIERAVFWIPPEKAVTVSGGSRREDDEEEDEDDGGDDEAETDTNAEPPVRAP